MTNLAPRQISDDPVMRRGLTSGTAMINRLALVIAATGLFLANAADAAPSKRKPVRRPAAKAAVKPVSKPVQKPAAPTTPGIMVPKAIVLSRPTPVELRAHAVWMLRAALNVAALQCQYSPFLRSVENYNLMLRKHGAELAAAQIRMVGHFRRSLKTRAVSGFDRYNTRSYNSFSTLDAQYNFCWAAGQAGLAVKLADVGTLGNIAQQLVPDLRAALAVVPAAAGLVVPPMQPFPDFRLAVVLDQELPAAGE